MTIKEYIRIYQSESDITMEDRIRYQLHKKGYSISELLLSKDRDGNEWSDKEREAYKKDLINGYSVELERFKSYISRMNKKGYKDLCKRLAISEEIGIDEIEEIKKWKILLEKEGISFKKRMPRKKIEEKTAEKEIVKDNTKPSQEIRKRRERIIEEIPKSIDKLLKEEELDFLRQEENLERILKKEFMSKAKKWSDDVIVVFDKYYKLFTEAGMGDMVFLCEYKNLNSFGKNIVKEIILQHLEEEDYIFSDDMIVQYELIKNAKDIDSIENRKERLFRIWDRWASLYEEVYISRCLEIAEHILRVEEEEWETLINYHRLQVRGEDLIYEGMKYLEILDVALGIVMDVPSLKRGI